jgi:hypothetical protein
MFGGNARYTSDSVDSTYFIEFNITGLLCVPTVILS